MKNGKSAKMKPNKQLRNFAVFAILAMALGLYLNKAGITGFAAVEYRGIDSILSTDVNTLQYELITGETKKIVFYARNNLKEQLDVEIGSLGKASNFITIEEKKFLIPPEDKKAVEIKLSAPLEAISQQYFGEIILTAKGKGKTIPIQINLKKRIQDAITLALLPQKTVISPGEEVELSAYLSNLAFEKAEVELEVKITKNNREIFSKKETVVLDREAKLGFVALIPDDAGEGIYNAELKASARMGSQYGVFEDRKELTVERPKPQAKEQEKLAPAKNRHNLFFWLLGGALLLMLLGTGTAFVKQEAIAIPTVIKILGIKPRFWKEERQFIKEGFSYIIDEKGTKTSYETLRMLHKEGFRVLCITRLNPKLLVEEVPELKLARIYWLTTQEGENAVGPTDIEGIYNMTDMFIRENPKSAIMLDGVSFLAVNVSFNQAILLLEYIKDKVSTTESIFIVPLNTKALDKKEKEQIAEEMPILDGSKEILLEIYKPDQPAEEKTGRKTYQATYEIHENIGVTAHLLDYVKKEMESGFSEENIISVLSSHGWPRITVEKAIKFAGQGKIKIEKQEPIPNLNPAPKEEKEKSETISQQLIRKAEVSPAPPEKEIEVKEEVKKEDSAALPIGYPKKQIPNETLLQEARAEYARLKKLIDDGMSGGKNLARFDMEMQLLSSDMAIAMITEEYNDIDKVRKKLEEIKEQMAKN